MINLIWNMKKQLEISVPLNERLLKHFSIKNKVLITKDLSLYNLFFLLLIHCPNRNF